MNYYAIIDRNSEGFGITFPDFPGCVSMGHTLDEVLEAGREVLAFHTDAMVDDGDALPAPSSLDAIKASGEWEIGADDVVATVPLIRVIGKVTRVGMSVDDGYLEAIDGEAKRRGQTRSAFMVAAALEQIA